MCCCCDNLGGFIAFCRTLTIGPDNRACCVCGGYHWCVMERAPRATPSRLKYTAESRLMRVMNLHYDVKWKSSGTQGAPHPLCRPHGHGRVGRPACGAGAPCAAGGARAPREAAAKKAAQVCTCTCGQPWKHVPRRDRRCVALHAARGMQALELDTCVGRARRGAAVRSARAPLHGPVCGPRAPVDGLLFTQRNAPPYWRVCGVCARARVCVIVEVPAGRVARR